MNLLQENGIISEMECGDNFAFILNDSAMFLSTEYKVLQSQEEGCFVKCMKLFYNGRMQFYYLTSGYKALSYMIPSLDADSFMVIMANLFANLLAVKQNGFLSCRNIDISFDKIFVDPDTYKAVFIYLPVSKRFYPDDAAFENELRTSLVKVISGTAALSSAKTVQFMSDLSNGMLKVKDLYDRIKGGRTYRPKPQPGAGFWDSPGNAGGRLRMIAMNAPVRVEIEITKDSFVIGKKAEAVDGVVSFNKMISRVHCRITRENGKYMITDLKSANGTYVNRVRLAPNRPQAIENGDIVRLADSDFQIVIS